MMMTKHIIAFLKGFILPQNSTNYDNRAIVATVNSELMQFGYILNKEAFRALSKCSEEYIKIWTNQIISYLRDIMGDGKYEAFHEGFPNTVEKMCQWEMHYHQIKSYWSGHAIKPIETETNQYTYQHIDFKSITVGDQNLFNTIFFNLVKLNAGLSPVDNEIVEWFITNLDVEALNMLLPNRIPFKETLCKLASKGLNVPVNSPTDVMRIAAFLSYGETNLYLPKSKKKRLNKRWNLTNAQKRFVLSLLNEVPYAEQMITKRKRWVTLARHIHPFKYIDRYPHAVYALGVMMKKSNYVKTWESDVEKAFQKSLTAGLTKLSERPSVYARRLDALIRKANTNRKVSIILNKFKKIAPKISNKVLFELWTWFEGRTKPQKVRAVWTGEKKKATQLKILPVLSEDIVAIVTNTIWNVLSDKFSKLEKLDKCWISKDLKKIPLPTNMKNLSKSLSVVIRGQRIKLDVNKTLRCYLHYANKPETDITIDLSAIFLSKKEGVNIVSWNNYKGMGNKVLHSGDSWSRTGNVSEYIDIDINKAAKTHSWCLIQLNNFNNSSLLENGSVFGFCEVESPKQNNKWIPKTVLNSFQVRVPSKTNLLLLDLENKEYMIVDQEINGNNLNNISAQDLLDMINMYGTPPKYSVYDLLKLHVKARGGIFTNKREADKVFSFNEFASSYDTILAYML